MTLSDEYLRQLGFRPWAKVIDSLPSLHGKTVLDLGCAVGDQAALLAARGARVIGIDGNQELLETARSRGIPNAEFRHGFLHALDETERADGIWCSFAVAYFTDFAPILGAWKQRLKPGGWIALTEIDELFGHEPVNATTRSLLDGYSQASLAAKRNDHFMGRKLRPHLEDAGFTIVASGTLVDRELSFDGPAEPAVLDGWRSRFERMKLLQEWCGERFEQVRDDFLAALSRDDHISRARVYYCVGTL